jgi:hypothetical protein
MMIISLSVSWSSYLANLKLRKLSRRLFMKQKSAIMALFTRKPTRIEAKNGRVKRPSRMTREGRG